MVNIDVPDIHYERPLERIGINSVGLKNVKTPPLRNDRYWLYPAFHILVSLPPHMRGVHVSRLYESLVEYIQPGMEIGIDVLEKIAIKILERNEYASKAIVYMRAYVMRQDMDKRGFPYYSGDDLVYVKVIMARDRGLVRRDLGIGLYTPIACPCALATAGHVFGKPYTHMNKAWLKLIISSNTLAVFPTLFLHDLDNILRPVNLLKKMDEALMVKKIVENPMFLEDLVRKAVCILIHKYIDKLRGDDTIIAKAHSIEPLHEYQLKAFLRGKISELIGGCRVEMANT
ncbi:MAG: GTP cyclohydrolase, FolE2/MptA family [Desulfurococcaceae archaeon]